jgi:Skp family chaperone for outer membrane proteins
MKKFACACITAALAILAGGSEIKIATVDLQRLTREYYRAQEVARELDARHTAFVKDLEALRLEGMKLLKEAEHLKQLSSDNTLSAAERENQRKALEMRLGNLRAFEVRYDETKAQREAELQNQAAKATQHVFQEVVGAARGVGEKEGFNLVLNMSLSNPTVSTVLFSKDVSDITDRVLASLNSARPLDDPTATNRSPVLKSRPLR